MMQDNTEPSRSDAEGVTAKAKARRDKRPEAPSPIARLMGEEMVCSAWQHAAAQAEPTVAKSSEQSCNNYTQINRKIVTVTGTLEAVDKAGMKSYLALISSAVH